MRAYAAPPPSAGDDSRPEDWAELLKKLRKARWDDAPKPWKEFWATRVAAAVVEVDVDNESVSAKEVEGIGLNAPKDKAEALERLKHNVVVYRQNYVLLAWGASTLLAALASDVLCAVGLLCAAAAAATGSDTLLGELQLATDGEAHLEQDARRRARPRGGVPGDQNRRRRRVLGAAAYVSGGQLEFFFVRQPARVLRARALPRARGAPADRPEVHAERPVERREGRADQGGGGGARQEGRQGDQELVEQPAAGGAGRRW